MSTCQLMKAGALASGAGVGAFGPFGASLSSGSGRREFSTGSLCGRNSPLSVEIGNVAQPVLGGREMGKGESMSTGSTMVCRAIGGGKNMYQPFRPPISIEIPAGATTIADQVEILRERRGLWFEYAALIPLLIRSGYTPAMIDEETGMTGVEQNIISVGAQVRNSLKASQFDEEKLRYFDLGGGELLYEIRILSAAQRQASAEFIIERNMSPKEARELARSVKDFDRRKKAEGFRDFTTAPGDCLAFAYYRQSRETPSQEDRESLLQKALEVCVSEKARIKIEETLNNLLPGQETTETETDTNDTPHLQVIRLLEGEVVGTKLPTMLPVVDATLESFEAAPSLSAQGEGLFNVFSTSEWSSWVAVPGWDPVVNAGAPVAVNFPDPVKLPLQSNVNGKAKLVEPTLVIIDKAVLEVDESQSLYVVALGESQELVILSASKVLENRVLGKVILALRPPVPPSEDPVEWE